MAGSRVGVPRGLVVEHGRGACVGCTMLPLQRLDGLRPSLGEGRSRGERARPVGQHGGLCMLGKEGGGGGPSLAEALWAKRKRGKEKKEKNFCIFFELALNIMEREKYDFWFQTFASFATTEIICINIYVQ